MKKSWNIQVDVVMLAIWWYFSFKKRRLKLYFHSLLDWKSYENVVNAVI